MFCMKCGEEIPDSAVYCFRCGSKVEAITPAQEAAEPEMFPTSQSAEPVSQMEHPPAVENVEDSSSEVPHIEESVPKISKKKRINWKIMMIGIGALAVVIAIIVASVFAFQAAQRTKLMEEIVDDLTGDTYGGERGVRQEDYYARWLSFSEGQQCHVETYDLKTDTYVGFDESYELVIQDEDTVTLYIGDALFNVNINYYHDVLSVVGDDAIWCERISREKYPSFSDMVAKRKEEVRLAVEEAKLPYNQMVSAVDYLAKQYDLDRVSDLSLEPGKTEGEMYFSFSYFGELYQVGGTTANGELRNVAVTTDLSKQAQHVEITSAEHIAAILYLMAEPLKTCDPDADMEDVVMKLLEYAEEENQILSGMHEENGWLYGLLYDGTWVVLSAEPAGTDNGHDNSRQPSNLNAMLDQHLDFSQVWQIKDHTDGGYYVTDYAFEADGTCYCAFHFAGEFTESSAVTGYYGTYTFSDNILTFHVWLGDRWADYTYSFDPETLGITQTSETALHDVQVKGDSYVLQMDPYMPVDLIKEIVNDTAPTMP